MKNKVPAQVLRQKAKREIGKSIATQLNTLLNTMGTVTDLQMQQLTIQIDQLVGVKAKNSCMNIVVLELAPTIEYIKFRNITNKFIVNGKGCDGEHTVVVYRNKVYDVLECIAGMPIHDYIDFLWKENTHLGIAKTKSYYIVSDTVPDGLSTSQWEALTNKYEDVCFDTYKSLG